MTTGILAEATAGEVVQVITWSVALLVLLVVGMFAAARLKRKIKQEEAPAPALGFTLSDLRQMHRSGQLTDDEFNKAKEKIVSASVQAVQRIPDVPGTEPPRDSADAIRARRLAREAQAGGGHAPDP